jgi:hypothetical protein
MSSEKIEKSGDLWVLIGELKSYALSQWLLSQFGETPRTYQTRKLIEERESKILELIFEKCGFDIDGDDA